MINLCMPDTSKSCAACCGLMNHRDISRENLTAFLHAGRFRTENYWRYQVNGSYLEQTTSCRDSSTHICPLQGFIAEGIPGCMVHPQVAGVDQRDKGLFGASTCRAYVCPAHTILSDEAKKIIIENLDDWYVYTIAVIDPRSAVRMINQLHDQGIYNGEDEFKRSFAALLENHAESLAGRTGNVFCYSVEEYTFSLND